MKFFFILSLAFCTVCMLGTSCQKELTAPTVIYPETSRKVQFSLYTAKDFSKNNRRITFTLSIRTPTHQTIWDSVLAPMKIKDIPRITNKLVI